MTPQRIQRKRTKGWRMPENTVNVDRRSRWGNQFALGSRAESVAAYRKSLSRTYVVEVRRFRKEIANALRGKNLACWCPLFNDDGSRVPCHADVLLEIANA